MPSILSFLKLAPVSMYQDQFSLIQNPLLLMKLELEPTDNSSILNNSFQERKMLLTTSPEDIILLVKKLQISASTESESLQINAQDFKVSSSSTLLVVVLDLDLDHSYLKDSPSTTERNQSLDSQSIHPHKSQLPSLSHTTLCCLLTHSQNIPMLPLCQTMKQSMISAEETWILRDQPTLI